MMLNRRRTAFILLLLVCALIYTLQYTSLGKTHRREEILNRPQHLWNYQKHQKNSGSREKDDNIDEDEQKVEDHVQFIQPANGFQQPVQHLSAPPSNLQVYNGGEQDTDRVKKYWVQKLKEQKKSTIETPYPILNLGLKVPENAHLFRPISFPNDPKSNGNSNTVNLNLQTETSLKETQLYIPRRRVVHFDFKGAPPKVQYLKKLFPLMKSSGATSVMLEWEDMLPFYGPLKSIKAKNHYSKQEVSQIIKLAKANNLEIIPLVQTFGHLEFVLKLQQWQHLREVPEVPQSLCPSLNDSLGLVKLMIDQTMRFHPDVTHLHIGCDEVTRLGECPRCIKKDRDALFLEHVQKVARYVRETYRVIPIIWDDMLRHIPAQDIKEYQIGELTEPMVWVYVSDVYRFTPQSVWEKYASVFSTAWTASAYKGAFGSSMYAVNVKRHLENNLSWLKVMQNEEYLFSGGFQGITITGWQRYDHFANLCELLPAALPSLIVAILATSNGFFDEKIMKLLYHELKCMKTMRYHTYVDWDRDPHLFDKLAFCDFPGSNFFRLVSRLKDTEVEIDEYIKGQIKEQAWLQDYNVRRNFSSADRVDSILGDLYRIERMLASFIKSVQDSLKDIFDIYTIAEWIELKVYPLIKKLQSIRESGENLKKSRIWPVRPFPIFKDLLNYGLKLNDTTIRLS